MTDFFARPVFRVENELFSWRDVVLFSHRVGTWASVLEGIEEAIACVHHAQTTEDEGLEDAVETAAAEFRYDRELITAEETETWLAERGVTAADWLASMRREVLRARLRDQLPGPIQSRPAPRTEIERAVRVDLSCTRLGQQLAEVCAEQAAAASAVGLPRDSRAPVVLPSPLPSGLNPEHIRERMPIIEWILQGVEEFRRLTISDEAVGREVRQHKMEWVRLECRTVAFPDLVQAREAALCVREDGLDLTEVAQSARRDVAETRFYVDDLDQGLQPLLLSAMPGDVIGPTLIDGTHTLFHVLSKTLPAESDPELRVRAAERLLVRALASAGRERVHWLIGW
jgi:hypothetical protein